MLALLSLVFALHLHVNEGAVTQEWIDEQVTRANELFAPAGIRFQIENTDAKSPERVMNLQERLALRRRVTTGSLHVFVTRELADVDVEGNQIRGVTLKKDATKYVVLSMIAPERVLAHELGHVFGLPHSEYPESIMNKTPRELPPYEERRFADPEVAKIKATATRLVNDRVLKNRAVRNRARR